LEDSKHTKEGQNWTMTPMTWMGQRDAKPKKGVKARIPFLGLVVTVVTASYFIEPMG
jgi:hypothetical protein